MKPGLTKLSLLVICAALTLSVGATVFGQTMTFSNTAIQAIDLTNMTCTVAVKGTNLTVFITPETRFFKNANYAISRDLAVGDLVHGTLRKKAEGRYEAVRIFASGAPVPEAAAAPAAPPIPRVAANPARRGVAPSQRESAGNDFEQFQGTWEFVSMEVEGAKKPEELFKKYTVVLKDDRWTVYSGGRVTAESMVKLDPTQKPKTIDLTQTLDPGKGRLLRGIYSLDGDSLTMCDRAADKGERPTQFATEPDSGLVLVALKRL